MNQVLLLAFQFLVDLVFPVPVVVLLLHFVVSQYLVVLQFLVPEVGNVHLALLEPFLDQVSLHFVVLNIELCLLCDLFLHVLGLALDVHVPVLLVLAHSQLVLSNPTLESLPLLLHLSHQVV